MKKVVLIGGSPVTLRQVAVLAVASLLAALLVGRLDQESGSFASLFSEAGNYAGLAIWAAGFFATGALVIASASPPRRS